MLIRSGDVTLRQFDASLTDCLYEIRNHPTVRRHLRDPRPIARQDHDRWVRENLVEERRLWLFVAYHRSRPAGIALIRNIDSERRSGEVGVMMVEAARYRLAAYKAAHLIGYFGFEVLGLGELTSRVPRRHGDALAFNRRCGFEPTGQDTDAYHELVLTRDRALLHPTHRRFRRMYRIETTHD